MRWSAAQTLAWIIQQDPLELNKWTREMGPKIEPAAKQLGAMIGASKISAWGQTKTPRLARADTWGGRFSHFGDHTDRGSPRRPGNLAPA
jgi:hypothetical protein